MVIFLFSCSEEKEPATPKANKKEFAPRQRVILPQPYYNLLNEIEFNPEVLMAKGIKQVNASIQPLNNPKQVTKQIYTAHSARAGEVRFALIQKENNGPDTMVKETIRTQEGTGRTIIRNVRTPEGKKVVFTITERVENNQVMERVRTNTSSGKKDREINTYQNQQLTRKVLEGLGEERYTYDANGLVTSYLLQRKAGDTVRYAVHTNNASHTEVRFLKGGNERFLYSHRKQEVDTIQWFQGNKKLVDFIFTYNTNGLPAERIVRSGIPAFPSTRTVYQYGF
jgi:hypothetical protein